MKDDHGDESLGSALANGRLGLWVKRQLLWLGVFAVGVGAFLAWGRLTGRI